MWKTFHADLPTETGLRDGPGVVEDRFQQFFRKIVQRRHEAVGLGPESAVDRRCDGDDQISWLCEACWRIKGGKNRRAPSDERLILKNLLKLEEIHCVHSHWVLGAKKSEKLM